MQSFHLTLMPLRLPHPVFSLHLVGWMHTCDEDVMFAPLRIDDALRNPPIKSYQEESYGLPCKRVVHACFVLAGVENKASLASSLSNSQGRLILGASVDFPVSASNSSAHFQNILLKMRWIQVRHRFD